ncbi:MAG: transcription antitermination factor NusB [Lapillicoccus sp.]
MADAPGGRRRGPRDRSVQRPADRARHTDISRLIAYTVMRAVSDGAYANLELPKALRDKGIHGRDAAFTTELVYGATRMRGFYDPVLAMAAGRDLDAIDDNVLDTLRLGCHQLLGMRVPSHAAVDETVALARQVNGIGASGFVNAVMRRVSERDRDTWLELVAPEGMEPNAARAVRTSHPEWIVRALRAALVGHGTATAETVDAELDALLASDNAAAKVTLVARPGLASPAELVAAGGAPGRLARTAVVLNEGDPGGIPAVREGRAAVQDEGSQLVALALAAATVDPSGSEGSEEWLDLCAGPGGKAGLLAGLALLRGAGLVANDVSEHRAALVRSTLALAVRDGGLGQIVVRVGDGREVGRDEPAAYDRVLIDAPCTGLGALRRRPEARWRRQPADVVALATLQRELLASGIDATRPGGVVAYATCSPHLNETRFVVSDVVKKRDDVDVEDARSLFTRPDGSPVPELGVGPFVQLWPHHHGTDAMFFALLRKR